MRLYEINHSTHFQYSQYSIKLLILRKIHHHNNLYSAWQLTKCLPIYPFDLMVFLKYIMITTSCLTCMHCEWISSRSVGPFFSFGHFLTPHRLHESCGLLHEFNGIRFLHLYSRSQLEEFSSDVTYFWLFPRPTKSHTTKQLWLCIWNTPPLRGSPLEVTQLWGLQSPRVRVRQCLTPVQQEWSH